MGKKIERSCIFGKAGTKKNIQGREKTRLIFKFKKRVETFATL